MLAGEHLPLYASAPMLTTSVPNLRARRTATFALTFVCLFWGATFLLMKLGTRSIKEVFGEDWNVAGGAFFLLVRFGLASLLMPIMIPSSVMKLDRRAWIYGFWISTVFAAGFLLQIFGLTQDDVNPGQSAFLTSLYVVSTPILSSLILRKWPSIGVAIGVVLATLGAAFIKGPPEGGLSLGAWATLACAVVFGGHIVMTDSFTRKTDPMALTLTMLLFSTLWMALALACAPEGLVRLDASRLVAIFGSIEFWISELLCAVLATVIALSVLNRWQKELSPSRAAVVYTSEPVFAALISIGAGEEGLTPWLAFGAGMILLANLSAEFIGRKSQKAAP